MNLKKIEKSIMMCIPFLLILFQVSICSGISPDRLRFKYITEEDGLTNSYIYCIGQDHKGFIWIGTENGLFRYDGYHFKHYLNFPGDTTSINSNVVFKIFTDTHNNLWFGTFMGLMRYNKEFDSFHDFNFQLSYRQGLPVPINAITEDIEGTIIVSTDLGVVRVNPENYSTTLIRSGTSESSYEGNLVTTYYIDRQGNHWIATEAGVSKIDVKSEKTEHYKLSDYAHKAFSTTYVHCIYEDSKSNIWIATREEGVFMKHGSSDKFRQLYYKEYDKNSLGSNEAYDIFEDETGQIWISTNGGGLNLFDHHTEQFLRIKHSVNQKNSLLNNNIRTIFKDRQGNIWIASFQAGINIYINHPQLFRHYDISSALPTDYQSSTVCSICQFEENKLWIGTDGGGLKLIDREDGTIITFLPERNLRGSFPDKVVMAIYRDRYGTYWFGTYQGGLVKYDSKNQRFISYRNDPSDSFSIRSNFITSILEDQRGNFWIGTNGGGLNHYDRNTGQFRAILNNPSDSNSLIDNFINDMIEDHNGDIWIGTFWGLSRFNTQQFRFYNYLEEKSKGNSLSHNTVFCLYEDTHNRLWVGTRNGLNRFSSEENSFYYFSQEGLSGCSIYGILEDNQGNLWISSNEGLAKFNPETLEVNNYTESDGLQGNEFFRNSCYKSPQGELFFGGINGFNAFSPDAIKEIEYIPPVVITSFKIFDEIVPIGKFSDGRRILERSIGETTKIKLRYSDKIFSFEVAALDFISPENVLYAYRMDGFDINWNYTQAQYPVITYTNLNPGDYTLRIKAGNKNIVDKIDRYIELKIEITPPVWKTWWAYILYIFILMAIAYYFWRLSIQRMKERELVRLEILKREKSEELNQAKLRFFTNISHEFRTPLTLIISPLEQLLRKGNESHTIHRQLDIMLKNARRMLRLINQLLDFRKIEGGKMTLKAEYSDIVKFIRDIVHSFEELASEKHINFKLLTSVNSYMLWFDPDKMDKILFNLLSNAFKFTPNKGSITIRILIGIQSESDQKDKSEYIRISVSDTGKGIPEKDLPNLFERFYQADNTLSVYQGSGLGLSLTKNFVEIHKGSITVDTSPQGTTFTILLPSGDAHLTGEQKVIPDKPGVNKYINLTPDTIAVHSESGNEKQVRSLHNKPTVLLVEDHLDLRHYLEEECKNYFNFYDASNGVEGFEMAVEILPDLIISDIVMPGMNGIEFCQKLKQNLITSHIPVVLLTAKSTVENQIEGYEAGADAYIPKPFQVDQLLATANSIIENRIRLREKFDAGKVLSNMPIKNTADDKFLQKVTGLINYKINEVEFGVLELSKELGISRVHLHRKLKSIANVSPNEFIKTIRLERARELLLQQEFTISEVCYKVGFNSPAYFSSCFKTYYQMSPSEFIERSMKA